MPRPCKRRRICAEPSCGHFGPKNESDDKRQIVLMTVDEFECIRLIDLEGMTQEQCANQMNIARTTAQAIYGSARAKLAECLVTEKDLHITGGDYILCDRKTECRNCGGHCKRHCQVENQVKKQNEE